MTARPQPTWAYHITRIEHLRSMVTHGLCSDTVAAQRSLNSISIAHTHLKQRRARRDVPIAPGGSLADYVPFYFAPRSPMLRAISGGKVEGHSRDCSRIVYLLANVAQLRESGLRVLGTDRHPLAGYARFTSDDAELTDLVDWALMTQRWWNDISDYPDRCERRQAELLVHQQVPWGNIRGIAAQTDAVHAEVRQILDFDHATPRTAVKPEWYF